MGNKLGSETVSKFDFCRFWTPNCKSFSVNELCSPYLFSSMTARIRKTLKNRDYSNVTGSLLRFARQGPEKPLGNTFDDSKLVPML
jgi:hypothetical protein